MLKVKNKIKKMCDNLLEYSRRRVFGIENLEYVESGYKVGNEPPKEGWKPLGQLCGAHRHFWIHATFDIPAAETGYRYMLNLSLGIPGSYDTPTPQGLVYLNGKMIQGLDINHTEVFIEPETTYDMQWYLYTNNMGGPHSPKPAIYEIHEETEALWYDLTVPLETLDVLNENTAEYRDTLAVLERAVNLLDIREPHSEAYYASVIVAREYLRKTFYETMCTTEGKPVVHCIGHTHIDVEWLWARRQTREKIQRSFSTLKALMDRYPEYIFTLSQPELYRYLKEEAPEKYEELKQLIIDGRFEPEGAMYVESDCNLVSGESLVRQILHGKQFFKQEFDIESKVLFLPDVFGYSAALPQILKKSGVDYFVTSKISWNDTNMLPYDSFMWKGIDGSEIYTTFITGQNGGKNHTPSNFTDYVGTITPSFVQGTWDRYQQKEYNKHTLLTYGHGDGGGGPTAAMLERYRRLSKGLPGLPVAKMDFLLPFLKTAEAEFKKNSEELCRMPKWVGELYLEYHRGTYTSIAKNKRNNRKAELALQKAEMLSYTDLLFGGAYDAEGLHENWRRVLHDQFHDILPGSSIEEVYDNTDKDYADIGAYCQNTIDGKLKAMAKKVQTDGGLLVYNPLGFATAGNVTFNGETVELDEKIPSFGWSVIIPPTAENTVTVRGLTAENGYYRMTLDDCGRIVSLYDKSADREIVLPGRAANAFEAYEDHPYKYDAWEINDTYKAKRYPLDAPATITPITDGMRSGFEVKHTYMRSSIVQKIWLYSKCRRIDFEHEIDWHNKHQLLKLAFPLDVHADSAAYEIQYGHVYRPTHENTSWEEARFEVCGHKWVDISENGYGIALLNDCKYGFNTEGSTLKLTVLKCAGWPYAKADEGKHVFTCSLLPHIGSLQEAGVIQEAYKLNQPLTALLLPVQKGELPDRFSLVTCDAENSIVETVKKAEADNGMIVRLYDAYNRRAKVTLTVPEGFHKAYLCDLMENELEQIEISDNKVMLSVKNFEIVTVKFKYS